jgi:transporter family protein
VSVSTLRFAFLANGSVTKGGAFRADSDDADVFGHGVQYIDPERYSGSMTWAAYAMLSAFFGALVAILGKIGVRDVDSNLAVALRTVIIVFFAWGIVLVQGNARDAWRISRHSLTFLVLSAIATGLSWLFYYKALKLGEASRVAPIDKLSVALAVGMAFLFLGEQPTTGNVLGAVLVTAGVLVAVLVR